MQTYRVIRYSDGVPVGSIHLSPKQFAYYEAIAQQPEGLIRIGDKTAFPFYDLDEEFQNMGPDETVFLEET